MELLALQLPLDRIDYLAQAAVQVVVQKVAATAQQNQVQSIPATASNTQKFKP